MPKILFVEDDQFIADIYMRKFSEAGFDVKNAMTGKDALRLLKEDFYDLMLLDLVIPELSGLDVLREIRSNQQYRGVNIRIVVFSNLSNEKTQRMPGLKHRWLYF